MLKNKVLHIVLNNFNPDYRVLKETTALASAGYKVTIYALHADDQPTAEVIDTVLVKRFQLWSRRFPKFFSIQLLKLLECYWQMLRQGLKDRPDIVHAHDLDGLFIGYFIAWVTRGALIYDSHELWKAHSTIVNLPNFVQRLVLRIEGLLARKANLVITVSQGLGNILKQDFHINPPLILRNFPEKTNGKRTNQLRQKLGIPDSSVILLYLGGILPNRGIELLLTGFAQIPNEDVYLVFLGVHCIPEAFDAYISENCRHRVLVVPPVHPRKVVETASSADIGVHPIRGTSDNHYFCLPNKFFEYIQAGLAVLVTDLPEMAALVKSHKIGEVFEDGNLNSLVSKLQNLIEDKAAREKMKLASQNLAGVLCWENEKEKLIRAYQGLLD